MNKIYLMSDIHGDWRHIRNFLNRIDNKYNNTDTIILLGDTGTNFFFNDRDSKFKTRLNNFKINLFLIRGNHEERPSILAKQHPYEWHTEPYWGWYVWVENKYPYIKYAMDYVAMYRIPAEIEYMDPDNSEDDDIEIQQYYKTLVIPGAYSVDKYYRLQNGWSWFPQEQLSESEMLAGKALIDAFDWKCDLVLSHTCPIIYEPTDLFLSTTDQSMVDKTMERYLGEIERKLDYGAWCWGHYHQFRDYPRKDGRFRTMLFNDAAIDLEDYMDGEINKL